MTTADALLRAVLADPDADTPRLVYADWCDDHGQPDRAALVRHQCRHPDEARPADTLTPAERGFGAVPGAAPADLIVRRGFVDAVSCAVDDWVGPDCPACSNRDGPDCPLCRNTGREPRCGVWAAARHPVRAVTLAGSAPMPHGRVWFWCLDERPTYPRHPSSLPQELYESLTGPQIDDDLITMLFTIAKWYPTEQTAVEDVSAAAVRWARRTAAGDPPLRKRGEFIGLVHPNSGGGGG
ncbi:TIGR02996 domain-containing protein [bacterium]|nr:TIGR02996 domain-containing protein [bacterium]